MNIFVEKRIQELEKEIEDLQKSDPTEKVITFLEHLSGLKKSELEGNILSGYYHKITGVEDYRPSETSIVYWETENYFMCFHYHIPRYHESSALRILISEKNPESNQEKNTLEDFLESLDWKCIIEQNDNLESKDFNLEDFKLLNNFENKFMKNLQEHIDFEEPYGYLIKLN